MAKKKKASGKHTVGPWGCQHYPTMGEPDCWLVYSDNAEVGHKGPAFCHGPDAEANARLISAAPELLEIVSRLVRLAAIPNCDHLAATPGFKGLVMDALAVVSRAEGK